MERLSVKLRTFLCPLCFYSQVLDPYVEGTQANLFPEFHGIGDGQCPACFSGRNDQRVRQITMMESVEGTDLSPTQINVASDEDLEATLVTETDQHGRAVLEDSGEVKQELAIVDGKAEVVEKPIFVEKQRELTKQEIADLKSKREASLILIDSINAAEFSPVIDEIDTQDLSIDKEADPTVG